MAVTGAWWSGSATVAGAIAGGIVLLSPGSFPLSFAAVSEPAVVDPGFTESIAPLLAARCLGCHAADEEISGGLRLDLRDGWAQGGDSGPAIVPGEPEQSFLVRAIRWEAGAPQMPPDGKLAEGAFTAPVILEMARETNIDMPISVAVAAVLAGELSVDRAIESLLTRPIRSE